MALSGGVNDDEQNFHRKLNQFSRLESVEDISLMAFCFGRQNLIKIHLRASDIHGKTSACSAKSFKTTLPAQKMCLQSIDFLVVISYAFIYDVYQSFNIRHARKHPICLLGNNCERFFCAPSYWSSEVGCRENKTEAAFFVSSLAGIGRKLPSFSPSRRVDWEASVCWLHCTFLRR